MTVNANILRDSSDILWDRHLRYTPAPPHSRFTKNNQIPMSYLVFARFDISLILLGGDRKVLKGVWIAVSYRSLTITVHLGVIDALMKRPWRQRPDAYGRNSINPPPL